PPNKMNSGLIPIDWRNPPPNAVPELALQTCQRVKLLQKCLTRLSSAHRAIIDLVYYHERSIDEAAEILGIPQNTVKTRMFYARNRQAKLLSQAGVNQAPER